MCWEEDMTWLDLFLSFYQNGTESTDASASFGYKKVKLEEKQGMVNNVFHSVAEKYDIMNDILSLGVHRCWKSEFVNDLGVLRPTKTFEDG